MAGESAYGSDFIGHYLPPLMYPAGLTRPVQMLLGTAVVLVNVTIYWLVRKTAKATAIEVSGLPGWPVLCRGHYQGQAALFA